MICFTWKSCNHFEFGIFPSFSCRILRWSEEGPQAALRELVFVQVARFLFNFEFTKKWKKNLTWVAAPSSDVSSFSRSTKAEESAELKSQNFRKDATSGKSASQVASLRFWSLGFSIDFLINPAAPAYTSSSLKKSNMQFI